MATGLDVRIKYELRTTDTQESLQLLASHVLSGADFIHGKQSIGTSEEALVVGDVSGEYSLLVENLDTTNFVEVRPGSGLADLIKIPPGKFAWIPAVAASATVFMIADTAACVVEYWAHDA